MKSLHDCHTDAVLLMGLLDGIDEMNNSSESRWREAIVASTAIAFRFSRTLADDLECLCAAERATRETA